MKPPSQQPQPESTFEHPSFEALYAHALRDLADRRLDDRARPAAARALAFLFREPFVSELVASDVLAVLHRSVDLSKVVRALLLGLVGVSAPEKIAGCTRAVADRALREGHLPSFISAMRILVKLPGYDGTVPGCRSSVRPARRPRSRHRSPWRLDADAQTIMLSTGADGGPQRAG